MNFYRTHFVWIGLVVICAMVAAPGCGDSAGTSGGGSDMDALAAQLEQSKKAEADAKAAAAAAAAKAAADQQAADEAARKAAEEAAAQQAAAAAQPSGRTTAGAGTVGEGGGYYSAIVAAHRHITTRVDDLAWTQALQHHKATTGEMPKTNEEFLKIMAEGGIPLPELEQGQELVWDPSEGEWGTLYIVEPNPAAAQPGEQPVAPPAQ